MAITGAYGAGFAKGFGTDFAGRIDERKKLQEKYADLMIDSAKAKAPKYAAQTAAYKSTVNQAKQLKDEFGFTDAEIVGIASKYDINKIYTDLFNQKAAAIQAGSVLGFDKGIVLNTLNLPAEASLPEGMSMEDGLRQVILNTQKNLDDSKNPQSEVSRRSAFGKAMANLLSLNPRASAEDQIKSMQIAGFSAEELMAWSPEAGRGDMFPEVTAGPLSLPGQDYKATDYESRKGQVRRDLARQFDLFNKTTGDIDATMGAVFKDSGSTAIEVAQNIEDASILFADLDKKIAFKGYGAGFGDKSQRSNVLDKLRRLINTEEELAALVKLESSGKITQMILDTNGTFDDADIEALLTGKPREDKPIAVAADVTVDTVTPEAAQTEAAVSEAEEAVTAPNANQQAAIAEMPNGNIVSRMLEEQGITPEVEDSSTDSALGLTDDDMGLPDSPVVDTLAPAISSGAATSEWIDSVVPAAPSNEELSTSIVSTLKSTNSAAASGLATAIDFLTGFVGGAQETKISRDLKKISKTQAEQAAEVAALGFTKYFTSDLPPQEVIDEVKDNYVKLFTSTSDTPAYKELQQLIQDRIEYADRKRAETPDVVQDNTDLESASPSQITQALASLSDMPDKIQEALFDTQGKINTYIASLFEETLEERIMQNEGQQNRVVALQALKDKIAAMREEAEETEVEPLVTRRKKPKKPKGMTSSDKARLKRAQKANELSGDSALLEMLVEKYGIALVQKEMGL